MKTTQLLTLAGMLLLYPAALLANGGAWRTGVPGTGSAAATDDKRATNVTIEEELLVIDLHQNYAAVEVRYKMKNTAGKVDQDFFFPVERWKDDVDKYQISVDGDELSWKNVPDLVVSADQPRYDEKPPIRGWKQSIIPFASGQSHEIVVKYRSTYAIDSRSMAGDTWNTGSIFTYSLSPAATWKGAIGKGKVVVNILHPETDDVSIKNPKDCFKRISSTRYEWNFTSLKPTLADDISILAHSSYETFSVGLGDNEDRGLYVLRDDHYFIEHRGYDVVASSTLKPEGDTDYKAEHVREYRSDAAWAEGVEGDGIGEGLTLTVKRPIPLDAIIITPGYCKSKSNVVWLQNNRVVALEITLNDQHTFTAAIPDEDEAFDYPILVHGYNKPVSKIKLVIKEVHHGTEFRDTCISASFYGRSSPRSRSETRRGEGGSGFSGRFFGDPRWCCGTHCPNLH